MQQDHKSYDDKVQRLFGKIREHTEWQEREDERRKVMYDIRDKQSPGWREPYLAKLRRPITKEEEKKIDGFLEQLDALPPEYED